MNRSHRILPVYTGDVSGVCSALFELGGMVVIHDPSGCNSTYNTHDETRWYDHDSLIFITGLTETDAILGNDEKLIRDVTDAAAELKPRFIALCSSPVPFISGTDFAAITKLIERKTGVPCFFVLTNGMHDYTVGAGQALLRIAERFVRPANRREDTLNILGLTPLDFGVKANPAALRAFAEEVGFSVISCWAMGSDLEELSHAAEASVNLVVSSAGLPAATYLHEKYGVPYVAGVPVGAFRKTLAAALQSAAEEGECSMPCLTARTSADSPWLVIGEPVGMGSLACAIEGQTGRPVRLVCPVEAPGTAVGPGDIRTDGEEEAEKALASAELVIGDPMYKWICPSQVRFLDLPHQAFSGRNGWKTAREITSLDVAALLS